MKGDLKRKTRPQGQDERVFKQDGFDGGQNSDTPAKKIRTNELALIRNAVAYRDRLEGGWGARLASDERYPGTGEIWDIKQHSVTGRWLMHRGSDLWLSAGRLQREWTLLEAIDTDKVLSSTATLTYTLPVDITGGVAAHLSNMLLVGVVDGQKLVIAINSVGSSLIVTVSTPSDVQLCAGTILVSAQPTTLTLVETGGSGVSGTVIVAGYSTPVAAGAGTVTVASITLNASFLGLTENNTEDYDIDVEINTYTNPSQSPEAFFYRDGALVGYIEFVGFGARAIESESGISGTAFLTGDRQAADHTYSGTISFTFEAPDIDDASRIDFFREGFVVFISGDTKKTVFVDEATEEYWLLSMQNGYGKYPIPPSGAAEYKYRYVYTYCRILNAAGEPDGSLDRTTGNLAFEGPSPNVAGGQLDYGQRTSSTPISPTNAMTVPFISIVGGQKITASAASYITSVGVYRTLDVGVNSPTTNPGEFVWVADVPIYSTSYSDTTSDEVLLARLEANIDSPIYRLQSRGFVPMDKGIGCIRDDFMFTAAPSAPSTSYCELFYAPRLIGYHNALQRSDLQDPVSHIEKTAESMIVVCPSSVYQFTTSIYQDVGRGLSFIPIIGNRYKVSATTGVSPENRPFAIDDSSFIAFCTDKTLRVFSGSQWGDPLDDLLVHKILENAETVVLGYIRGVILVWISGGVCLRYAFGGDPGSKWSEILRDSWPDAQVAAVWEDDAAAIRLVVASDGTPYVVEDEGGRIYEDEVPASAPVIRGTSALANISIDGWTGVTLYGGFRYGFLGFFESEADRNGWVNMVGSTAEITEPAVGVVIGGAMSGSIDVLSLDVDDFTVIDGIGVGSYARIDSLLRFRDLAATQDSFRCFHKSSYASMLFPYGMPVPQVRATWYGDGVVRDQSVIVPGNGSIQSFKRIDGQRIQLELEVRGSGWQIDSLETKYQTHDARNKNGPQNGPEALMQAELAQNMIAWLNGDSGLRNRVGGAFVGPGPDAIEDPQGGVSGQDFSAPVNFSLSRTITDFSVMFWVKDPVTAVNPMDAAPFMAISGGVAVAFLNFVDASTVSCGSFQFTLPAPANDGEWHHYALTRDGNKFRVFQDGSLIGEATLSPGVTALIDTVRASAQRVFDPRLYDVRLSNEAVAYYYANLGGV